MTNEPDIALEEIFSEKQIETRIQELVNEIVSRFHGQELTVAGLLKGSFVFLADMIRHFHRRDLRVLVDFMTVSSYGTETESSGKITLTRDLTMDIAGKHVLLVDDILDTGRTMELTVRHLSGYKPASIATCVLLDKPSRRAVPFKADFTGFEIPDQFVVGYGLDYAHRYREFPNICKIVFTNRTHEKKMVSGND